ncbi:MAG: hypothetical protein WD795_17020 [Woeseia sp.]
MELSTTRLTRIYRGATGSKVKRLKSRKTALDELREMPKRAVVRSALEDAGITLDEIQALYPEISRTYARDIIAKIERIHRSPDGRYKAE